MGPFDFFLHKRVGKKVHLMSFNYRRRSIFLLKLQTDFNGGFVMVLSYVALRQQRGI
jgi:hypothetical protein